jgi:hypothetical protein
MIKVQKTTGGYVYPSPFLGPTDHTVMISVAASIFATGEVDADGVLKPGVPIAANGTLVTGVEPVFGVTIGMQKIATTNATADLSAAGTVRITIAVIGVVLLDVLTDVLERSLTATELAGFELAGCHLVLWPKS